MAQLNETFSTQTLPQSTNSFEPLPAGWYTATIAGAELKSTKAGTGQFISVKYNIDGPTHNGRVVFGNINIRNPNQTAEEIGRQQLGEIMRATGLAQVQDTDQLIGGQLQIKLTVKESEQYGASNEVKGFKAAGNAPAAPATAPAATGKAAPPWAKK